MISTRPFDSNPEMGITRLFHYDDVTDQATIETVTDVTALVEANKYLANTETYRPRAETRRVASLPLAIYTDLKRRGILDDEPRFRAWLRDPDNRYFRTNTERL